MPVLGGGAFPINGINGIRHEGHEEGGEGVWVCSVMKWYEVVWRGGGWPGRRRPWRAGAGVAAKRCAGLSLELRPIGVSPVLGEESELGEIIRPLFYGKSNETR